MDWWRSYPAEMQISFIGHAYMPSHEWKKSHGKKRMLTLFVWGPVCIVLLAVCCLEGCTDLDVSGITFVVGGFNELLALVAGDSLLLCLLVACNAVRASACLSLFRREAFLSVVALVLVKVCDNCILSFRGLSSDLGSPWVSATLFFSSSPLLFSFSASLFLPSDFPCLFSASVFSDSASVFSSSFSSSDELSKRLAFVFVLAF